MGTAARTGHCYIAHNSESACLNSNVSQPNRPNVQRRAEAREGCITGWLSEGDMQRGVG